MSSRREMREKKKRAGEAGAGGGGGGGGAKKYRRRGDVEKEQYEKRKKEETEEHMRKKRKVEEDADIADAANGTQTKDSNKKEKSSSAAPLSSPSSKEAVTLLPRPEVYKRLRLRGEPTTFFGETDDERMRRLRKLEIETPDFEGAPQEGRNDWMVTMKRLDEGEEEVAPIMIFDDDGNPSLVPASTLLRSKQTEGSGEGDEGGGEGGGGTSEKKKGKYDYLDDLKEEDACDQDKILLWIVHLLKEWERGLSKRDDKVKQSRAGKVAAATYLQSEKYLKPLLRMLRKRDLPADMLESIGAIVRDRKSVV
eukprot:TRINITY_DN52_c0_g1_i1.p1 TRINITY_DN52_c0_g1~~TRINITY_DN52_c0_g1_i1.p1  ORF type:complete len:309 (+),score=96.54 TRINITY_DN52_c0_g1_i1:118-1044(+)